MPLSDSDPGVEGAQPEGEALTTAPVVMGARGPSGLVAPLAVDAGGRLKAVETTAEVPTGGTAFDLFADEGNLDINSDEEDDSSPISNGQNLFIQSLLVGSEQSGRGSKVELFWVNGATETLITRVIVNGPSRLYTFGDLNFARGGVQLTGNGTAFLRMVRDRLDGGRRMVLAEVRGYTL